MLIVIFTQYGIPAILFSDQGKEFDNKQVKYLTAIWNINDQFVVAHNPQANGQAEAAVKIISQKLLSNLHHIADTHRDKVYLSTLWNEILPYIINSKQIVYSYNTIPNKQTGYMPYQLLFGRAPHSKLNKDLQEHQDILQTID